jgi:hypothetical protein
MPSIATAIWKSVKPPSAPLRVIESGKRTQTVKRCQACDGINRSEYLHCGTCRELWALTQMKWRKAQTKAGLCIRCVDKTWKLGGHKYVECKTHRIYGRELSKRLYAERKEAGQCVDCKAPDVDGVRCDSCKAKHVVWHETWLSRKKRAGKRTFKRVA